MLPHEQKPRDRRLGLLSPKVVAAIRAELARRQAPGEDAKAPRNAVVVELGLAASQPPFFRRTPPDNSDSRLSVQLECPRPQGPL